MAEVQKTRGARIGRIAVRVLLGIAVIVVVLAGAGAIWNATAIHQANAAITMPGKLYDVDGRKMHLYCTGQGSPTVLLETGLGDDLLVWGKIQPEISKITQVCSYDRAGFGWSEERPGVRDADAISKELYGLVTQADIPKPFILMGHSIAGIHMRAYAARHPEDLAGIVFIDGSTPRQDLRFPAALKGEENKILIEMELVKAATAIGVMRAMGQCNEVRPGFEAYAAWIKADSCHPEQYTSIKREMEAVPRSGDETLKTGPFGALPILIFSQDPDKSMAGLPDNLAKEMSTQWNMMQEDLKKLSTHSRRIIASGSTHYVQIDRSELVNREVIKFIDEVRTGTLSPANGSTTRE